MKKFQQLWLSTKVHTIWKIEFMVAICRNRLIKYLSHDKQKN
jgi:hypothetical protein